MDSTARFRQALEEHRHQVYTLACYHLGSEEEAEDVTQEVFVRLWGNWREVGARPSCRPWLLRVARNLCLDHHRHRQRGHALFAQLEDPAVLEQAPEREPGPDQVLESAELRGQLEEAIRQLEDPFRAVVILREIEELSYTEIAEALEMSMDQVKVTLHRARKRLREMLMERVSVNDI
ncbi:MAG: ECF RNA polymerase sigma factor SigW [bacterium]|nr:ECF RNA polymerase sigma factor SigW [bacterium]